jgi:hypothetical protein
MSKKLILTESQIQMILEYSMSNELRNPDDPLNYMDDMETPMSEPIVINEPFQMVGYDNNQYLLVNPETSDVLYAIGDGFGGDIYNTLKDYFSIPQEEEGNEDGTYSVPVDGWEGNVTEDDLVQAVTSYTNDQYNKSALKVTDDPQAFQYDNGDYEFLVIRPETLNDPEINDIILSPEILTKAQTLFNGQ